MALADSRRGASGGVLSKRHPPGGTGVANVCEVVWHLRGEADGRQVEGAKVGLAHVVNLQSACTIQILEKVERRSSVVRVWSVVRRPAERRAFR